MFIDDATPTRRRERQPEADAGSVTIGRTGVYYYKRITYAYDHTVFKFSQQYNNYNRLRSTYTWITNNIQQKKVKLKYFYPYMFPSCHKSCWYGHLRTAWRPLWSRTGWQWRCRTSTLPNNSIRLIDTRSSCRVSPWTVDWTHNRRRSWWHSWKWPARCWSWRCSDGTPPGTWATRSRRATTRAGCDSIVKTLQTIDTSTTVTAIAVTRACRRFAVVGWWRRWWRQLGCFVCWMVDAHYGRAVFVRLTQGRQKSDVENDQSCHRDEIHDDKKQDYTVDDRIIRIPHQLRRL